MKWLGYGVVFVAAVLVVLYVLTPPVRYSTEVVVDRPPEAVWAVFSDTDRMGEWLPGFRSAELISGEPGAPGSRYRLVFEEEGRRVEFEEEVLAVDPPFLYAFRMRHPMLEGEHTLRFEDLGGRTRIVSEDVVRGSWFYRFLMPLAKASMKQRQQDGYRRLKEIVERDAPAEGSFDLRRDPTVRGVRS